MASQQQELQALVSQLESHLNSGEITFKSSIRIASNSSDDHLDDLFLDPSFNTHKLISALPILLPSSHSEDLYHQQSKCLDQASTRLKSYIENLNDHIVHIVESESDEFLEVASKLESFKVILNDLKDGVKEYSLRYKQEQSRTSDIMCYLAIQDFEMRQMMEEKRKLEGLIRLQEMYQVLDQKVQEIMQDREDCLYIELEECVRMLHELKVNAEQAKDQTFKHHLIKVEQQMLELSLKKVDTFVSNCTFFKNNQNIDEEQWYFEECEFASYLRIFKIMGYQKMIYERLQNNLLKPQITGIIKKSYESRNNTQERELLPFQVYIRMLNSEVLQGTMKGVLSLTTDQKQDNFVSSYSTLKDCIWPLILSSLDQSLSFIYSNQQLFHRNYQLSKNLLSILKPLEITQDSSYMEEALRQRFNLNTYLNLLMVETTENFQKDLERVYEQTTDKGKSLHPVTIGYAEQVLGEGSYLQEIGDKMIKLAIQMIIRQLNWVMDKVNEKKSLATERILFILEDLNKLQQAVQDRLAPLITQRVQEASPNLELEFIQTSYLKPLLSELSLRFEHLVDPCLQSLATRISQRLIDNIQAFKQIPALYRMTSRGVSLQASSFLDNTMRPLSQLDEQKMFQTMSITIKYRIYETVLYNTLKELRTIIDDTISEERKMHESLKKYKREETSELSDFDKMLVQYIVV